MLNPSGIRPVGETLLILPEQIEEKTASGIYVGTPAEVERQQLGQIEGVVVAVSPYAWADEVEPRAKVGDKVIFAKYAGMVRKGKDELTYRLINDTDVKAVLESE